ncbi:MAG TPA: PilZ domain-containing protein [Pyrinomonadaceae bacterium]|nr:PilZ domain-containing protein [Pyrinomonadaceae bacterium]
MEGLRNKASALLREYVTERRSAHRRNARYAARIPFNVSVAGAKPAAALAGRTRDLGESGLNLVVPSIRIGGDYITLKENKLSVALELPGGTVSLIATAARFEQLAAEGEGYLVGVRIEEMSDDDRERYVAHLRTLPQADRRRDTLHLREA